MNDSKLFRSHDRNEVFEIELTCSSTDLPFENAHEDDNRGVNSTDCNDEKVCLHSTTDIDAVPLLTTIQQHNSSESLDEVVAMNQDCSTFYFLNLRLAPISIAFVALFALLFIVSIAVVAVQPKQVAIPNKDCASSFEISSPGGVFVSTWAQYTEYAALLDQTQRCVDNRTNCHCLDFTLPQYPNDWREQVWLDEFHEHLEQIQEYADDPSHPPLDVVLLGDSIIEHWHGTDLGMPNANYEDIVTVYERLFRPEHGADISGLAFGIGGDRCANLLYRVENGMMNDALQPAVWWLLIGTNDVGGEYCRDEVVVSGILLIAETVHQLRPNATVVINSLLPRGNEKRMGHWAQHSRINQALSCYAEGQDGFEFFNATSLFMQSDGVTINGTLLLDELHPNAVGAGVWGEAIVKRVQEILRAKDH